MVLLLGLAHLRSQLCHKLWPKLVAMRSLGRRRRYTTTWRTLTRAACSITATLDAIFFDSPFVGVLAYPKSYSVPLALVVAATVIALAVFTARQDKK